MAGAVVPPMLPLVAGMANEVDGAVVAGAAAGGVEAAGAAGSCLEAARLKATTEAAMRVLAIMRCSFKCRYFYGTFSPEPTTKAFTLI